MMRIAASESRYRAMLSPDELLIYASAGSPDGTFQPLLLPPLQVAKLSKLLDDLAAEATGNGAGWRVDRQSYQAKAG